MGRSPGVALGVVAGEISMRVTRSSHAEDKLWDAIEDAQIEHLTPAQVKSIIKEAWEYHAERQLKWDMEEFDRA